VAPTRGPAEGGPRPRRAPRAPPLDRAANGAQIAPLLEVAPLRPHVDRRVEIELELGVGKDDRALVAALRHQAARFPDLLLQPDQLGAALGRLRDGPDRGRDLEIAGRATPGLVGAE